MDDGRERDPEPGRDDHQAIDAMDRIDHRELDLHLTRRQLFGLTARGIGVGGARRRCSAAMLLAAAAAAPAGAVTRRPAGSPACRTSRRRRSASSSCTSPAGRRSSRRSTTSRRSRSSRARRFPTRSAWASASPQTMGQSSLPVAQSMFEFAQHGKSGTWVSELLPHTAKIVDDITVIKTMNTEAINHDPAITFIQTGFQQPGRPSMGAWLSYGLGSENQNLPAFVVLLSQAHAINADQPLFSRLWGSGFLPSSYQGVRFRAGSDAGALSSTIRRASARRRAGEMLDAVGEAEHDAARRVRRSGDRDAHRAVRDGLPDADVGAGADGSVEGARLASSSCTARSRASRAPTPRTACSRAGWPSATSGSSSSITAAGTSTATCRATSRCSARTPISRPPRSSPT